MYSEILTRFVQLPWLLHSFCLRYKIKSCWNLQRGLVNVRRRADVQYAIVKSSRYFDVGVYRKLTLLCGVPAS